MGNLLIFFWAIVSIVLISVSGKLKKQVNTFTVTSAIKRFGVHLRIFIDQKVDISFVVETVQ